MELTQAVSQRIKKLLSARDFTQYTLFEYSGVPCSTISMICSCKVKDVRMGTLLNLCRGLNISLTDFFDDALFSFENLSDGNPETDKEKYSDESVSLRGKTKIRNNGGPFCKARRFLFTIDFRPVYFLAKQFLSSAFSERPAFFVSASENRLRFGSFPYISQTTV